MADGHLRLTGDKYIDGRLARYSDPSRIDQNIKEAAAEFNKGKDITDKRNLMIAYFNKTGRFVFIPGKGWLDLMHVASAYAASKEMGARAALISGWGVELAEWSGAIDLYDWAKKGFQGELKLDKDGKLPNQPSGFQAEDIRSNRVGALMQMTGKDVRGVVLVNKIPDAAEAAQLGKAELMTGAGTVSDVVGKQMKTNIDDAGNYVKNVFWNIMNWVDEYENFPGSSIDSIESACPAGSSGERGATFA